MQNNLSPEEKEARFLAFRSSWKGTLADLMLLALAGCYFTTAFPGVDFSLAAWTGIIPLIALCAGRSVKRAALYGFVFGYFWSLTACFFLREISIFIPFVFAAVLGAFIAGFGALIPFFFRYILYPEDIRSGGYRSMKEFYKFAPWAEILCSFSLAGWWTILEWIRSWIFTGFPWNLAAATQWQNNSLIQICEFTGIYGVSFLVVLINISAYFALRGFRYSFPQGRYKRPWAFLASITLCLTAYWVGSQTYKWRKAETSRENTRYLAMGVIQPHLLRDGNETLTLVQQDIGRGYRALEDCRELTEKLIAEDKVLKSGAVAEAAAMSGTSPIPNHFSSADQLKDVLPLDLIVWPESAVPSMYYSGSLLAGEYRKTVRKLLKDSGVPMILGTITVDNVKSNEEYDILNSALMLRLPEKQNAADPFFDKAEVYSKVHLVPFGEFIPFNDKFPVIGETFGMGRNMTEGKKFHPLTVKDRMKAGILICYEDVFPYTAREQVKAGANFLLVITNDAWYPTSLEPVQHYANSVFRTIETRLPMVRCGHSDYSVLIDSHGNLVDSIFRRTDPETGELLPDPGRKGAGAAKFIVPVPKKHTQTFYTRYGNVFVFFCWLLFAAGLFTALIRKFEFRKKFTESLEEKQQELRKKFLDETAKS